MRKFTPAARRASSQDHTSAWLERRSDAWAEHEAQRVQARAAMQHAADTASQERQRQWADWHAAEQQRQAVRQQQANAAAQAPPEYQRMSRPATKGELAEIKALGEIARSGGPAERALALTRLAELGTADLPWWQDRATHVLTYAAKSMAWDYLEADDRA